MKMCFKSISIALGLLSSAIIFHGSVNAAPVCGSEDHWIDTCSVAGGPGGDPDFYTDSFFSSATFGIDTDLDNVSDMTFILSGDVTVFRGDPYASDPNDPNHLNTIDTELVFMELTGAGVTLRAGDGVANLMSDGPLYSSGQIIEKESDPAWADSFFDVFVEIDIAGIGTLHNQDAFRIESEIDKVPPLGINYTHPLTQPIDLLDANGTLVARLVEANHKPIPEPSSLFLLSLGLLPLAYRRKRKA